MRSLELFTGAGGLALGTRTAGFQHVALLEWNRDACRTLRENVRHATLPGVEEWNVIEGDVRACDYESFGTVRLVAGGPPCQPFSIGGKHRGMSDARDEQIGKAYAKSDGLYYPVFVPLEHDLTRWLLGRWLPLPLLGRFVGALRLIFRWLLPLASLLDNLDKIESWRRTIEVFLVCDSGERADETPAQRMAVAEQLLRQRSESVQQDLESLLQDIKEELRKRRVEAIEAGEVKPRNQP